MVTFGECCILCSVIIYINKSESMAGVIYQKIFLFGFGALFFIGFGIVSVGWPVFFFSQLENQLVLTNVSKSYTLWKETPIPMYMDVYMFHWTNPEETINNKAVPHFIEKGPYVFSEKHKKVDVDWINSNNTVTFKQIRHWEFIPEKSNGSLNDQITNINVIALTVGNMIKKVTKDNPVYNIIVNKLIKVSENSLYVTKSVRELLFDGYDDKFLDIAKKLQPILKIKVPFDKFGWFYNRNNSVDYDGIFNMNTGALSMSRLGIITNWNHQTHTQSYSGNCNLVQGTSGELWPYNASKQDEINIFATDICSSIKLKANMTKSVQGVYGQIFTGDDNTFDNGQKNQNNSCYCSNSDFSCPPSGVRDISTCRYGAPAFISYPHFYLADKSYRNAVSGLNPNSNKHQFYLVLEKTTSIPLEVRGRLQINILSQSIPGLDFFKGLPTAYMPMVWFDQSAKITPELSQDLETLDFLNGYMEYIFIGIASFGFILISIGLLLWLNRYCSKSNSMGSPLLDNSESTDN